MHGLINRSVQCFLQDTYGRQAWSEIAEAADLGFDSFEALLIYDDALTDQVLKAAAQWLGKPVETILEDLGTYLVSHPNVEALRRLLRFGGETFAEFLHSLDELQDRSWLAVPDLELPELDIRDHEGGVFTLYCKQGNRGFGHVLVGVLRAMADDYGTLVLLDHLGCKSDVEEISIQVLETSFSEGRTFNLAVGTR